MQLLVGDGGSEKVHIHCVGVDACTVVTEIYLIVVPYSPTAFNFLWKREVYYWEGMYSLGREMEDPLVMCVCIIVVD